jgi:integrase
MARRPSGLLNDLAAGSLGRILSRFDLAAPDQVFGEARRRALTPEEAGLLLARFPLFWWDHVVCLLGTGLRFGEFAGLRWRRVHLDRPTPVLQVVDTRHQAGRFGSGFKSRPKSDAGIREIPLAPVVAEAIRSQLPPGADPDALVFAGPGGGNNVAAGTRTVLSRHGVRYRHTTDAMAVRVVDAIELRLRIVLQVAENHANLDQRRLRVL